MIANNQNKNTLLREFDTKEFWIRLWRLLSPSHRQIKYLLFSIMVVEILRLGGSYILKIIIDTITNFQADKIPFLIFMVFAMFFSNQIVSLANFLNSKVIFRNHGEIHEYLSNNAYKKMMFLDLGYHEKENMGNKVVKVHKGVDKITDLLGNLSWEVIPTSWQVLFTTVALFIVDWRFGIIVLVFVPTFMFLTLRVNKRAYPFRWGLFNDLEEASGLMAQSVMNINTVKSFVQERKEVGRFEKITNRVKSNIFSGYGIIVRYNLTRNLIIDSGRLFILLSGAYLVWKGMMTVGSLVFVFTISEKALISLYRISRLYDQIMESSEAVERLYSLSLEKPEISNPSNGFRVKKINGRIEFKNVSFAYKESAVTALDKVNLVINSGCVTALVGPSGGGKTTLVRMMYRHYDPTEGEIILDGRNLKKYDLYAFRKFMAIVPQEVEIFNTSVRGNISYAKPNASWQEIQAAAKIANAEEFILQLKDGYDTMVGERGIKLSGGQRQRIGIARAILANPRILIFDEATSSLDSYSERLIQDAMDKISRGRTVILIAHRLSTIKKADKIVVLEKGKVVEEGSHVELSRLDGGLYQKLLKLQAMGEVD